MRRLLIVAPHFAPISAPDGQRVRTLLPHLPDLGWEAQVLTVHPAAAEAPLEPELTETLPSGQPVTRVSAIPPRLSRPLGLGNIAWRAWLALRAAGHRLLSEQRFDLVYFSTTQSACFPLGRLWQRRHRTPFVIDLQDPWRTDFVHRPGIRPPGGWKYRFAAAQARRFEPWTLRRCTGIVSVSPAYLEQLSQRYPWWNASRGRVIPMGWSEHDFIAASAHHASPEIRQSLIRYIGRLGSDLDPALHVFLAGFARATASRSNPELRCEFRGGSYDPRAVRGPVRTAAAAHGISTGVAEDPVRVPYLTALDLLRTAGANLILGSEDSGYAPSKIWLTLAARRPWLALARRGTVLHETLAPHAGDGGWLVDPTDANAPDVVAAFCDRIPQLPSGSADASRLASFEARELARRHGEFFDELLSAS
jgi:hypothetical protein